MNKLEDKCEAEAEFPLLLQLARPGQVLEEVIEPNVLECGVLEVGQSSSRAAMEME